MKMSEKALTHARKYRVNNRQKINENARLKRKNNPWESKKYHYRKLYGITPKEYESLLTAQGGVCAICGGIDPKRSLGVDHNHDTGKIRGLLCMSCNIGIGNLDDNVELLTKAIVYLSGGVL